MSRCCLLVVLAIALGCLPLTASSEATPICPADRSVAEAYPRPSGSSSAVVPVGTNRDTTDADTTRQADRKSPGRALARSLGGTVLLAPVFGVGLIVGPSLGHFYADNDLQAGIGIGVRLLGGAVVVVGLARIGLTVFEILLGDPSSSIELKEARRLAGIGGGIVSVSALVDIVTAPIAAQNYNEARGITARVGPAVGLGAEQVGLALKAQF